MSKGISNCKHLITTLKIFSADHEGRYPDQADPSNRTSNDAFRHLCIGGYATTESIFGCPSSPFRPDGDIGSSTQFAEALRPGENHWAMTKGVKDDSGDEVPLVIENPFSAEWPPKWTAVGPTSKRHRLRGDSWGGGRIIIGLNDSSVSLLKLKPSATGSPAELGSTIDGKMLFESAIDPKHFPKGEILDVSVEVKNQSSWFKWFR